MQRILLIDAVPSSNQGLRDDLPPEHASSTARNPQVLRAIQVHVQLFDLERI